MGKTDDRAFYLLGVRVLGDFGATIAVPAVVLSWLGRKADLRWDTAPAFLVVGFALAALISCLAIWRKAKRYSSEYQRLIKKTADD